MSTLLLNHLWQSTLFGAVAAPPLALVRAMLADQFGVRLRRESRPVYILQGPAADDAQDEGPQQSKQDVPKADVTSGDAIHQRDGWLIGAGATAAQLAAALSQHLSSPVLDHTSRRGTYEFKLKTMPRVDADALARQLHRQLGLTLKSFSREQLIIEQAERPAATGYSL